MKRGLARTMIAAAAATAILSALVGWSAANEAEEAREVVGSRSAMPKAPPNVGAVAPVPLPVEPTTLRTGPISKPAPPPAPKPGVTQAMPDGGVPKRRARRVPNDLLNPY
jgi:hypothetical protein